MLHFLILRCCLKLPLIADIRMIALMIQLGMHSHSLID